MNIFNRFPSFNQLFKFTSNIFRSNTSSQSSIIEEQKWVKENVNDTTMESIDVQKQKSQIQSQYSNNTQINDDIKNSSTLYQQYYVKNNKKRHRQVYYNQDQQFTNNEQAKYYYYQQQYQKYKRRIPYQQQSQQLLHSNWLKKYINSQGNPILAQQKYLEINYTIAINRFKPYFKSIQQSDSITYKITFRPQDRQNQSKIRTKFIDLPYLSGFNINYTIQQLRNMSLEQLMKVSNLIIKNKYGQIYFQQPVNLLRKNLRQCLTLTQKQFKIKDYQLKQKKMKLILNPITIKNKINLHQIECCIGNQGLQMVKMHSNGSVEFRNY